MERTCEAPSNEAPHMMLGYRQGRLPTYLHLTVAHAVPLSVCFMVFFACYSHLTGFSRRRSAAFLQTSEQFVQHFSCADLFTLRFPYPFLRGTEITANPLSKCVCLLPESLCPPAVLFCGAASISGPAILG